MNIRREIEWIHGTRHSIRVKDIHTEHNWLQAPLRMQLSHNFCLEKEPIFELLSQSQVDRMNTSREIGRIHGTRHGMRAKNSHIEQNPFQNDFRMQVLKLVMISVFSNNFPSIQTLLPDYRSITPTPRESSL